MSPGLELDLLIAVHAMGKAVVKNKSGSKRGGYYYSLGKPIWNDFQGEMQLSNPIPPYSTDIAAAWQVVEKLTYVFELTTNNPYGPSTPETEWLATFNVEFEAHGNSAPHAISLAALKACGERATISALQAEVEQLKEELLAYQMGADIEARAGDEARAEIERIDKLASDWQEKFADAVAERDRYKAALERIASLTERQALQGTLDEFAAKEMEIIAREALKETK